MLFKILSDEKWQEPYRIKVSIVFYRGSKKVTRFSIAEVATLANCH